MLCIAAFLIFLTLFPILGFFPGYRRWFRQSWLCVWKKVRLQPCDLNVGENLRTTLLAPIAMRFPRVAKFFRRTFVLWAFAFVVLNIWSVWRVTWAGLNLLAYDTCNTTTAESCSLSGEACGIASTQTPLLTAVLRGEVITWGSAQLAQMSETLRMAWLRFQAWHPEAFLPNQPSYYFSYQENRPTTLEVIDPGCSACRKLYGVLKKNGVERSTNLTYIPYAIPGTQSGTTKFRMSTTFVRYLHALRALPRTTEGVSMDWILLDALFTRSDSAGNPYQESFNFTYANTELEEKLHALLRTLGLSDAQVQQVVLRAHSNDVTQTIAAEQQIVEQQLKTRRIPTLLFGGRRYDRVVSDRELQSGAPVLPLVQYVTQTPSPSPSPLPVKVIFGGDMMYDRHIRLRTQEHGLEWPLQALAPLFHTANAVIVNGEGPITTFSSKSVGSAVGSHDNFIFTFPIGVAQTWQSQGVTHVNLGNNHILNFGQEGLQQTWTYLNESGIAAFGYTGQQRDVATQPRTQTLAFPGLRIALVNYNQFVAGGEKAVFADIAAVRPTHDVVIVYTHWGDEYAQVIRPPIRDLAHRMIDAGADLIVGSHPHVVQPVETYNGKQIYYSLGNLVFDQYFQKETQEGLLLEIQLEGGKGITSLTTHAVQLVHSGQTILLPEQ